MFKTSPDQLTLSISPFEVEILQFCLIYQSNSEQVEVVRYVFTSYFMRLYVHVCVIFGTVVYVTLTPTHIHTYIEFECHFFDES